MEDNVGTIVIGTKVNKKGLEKGIKEIDSETKQLEEKPIKITKWYLNKASAKDMQAVEDDIKSGNVKIIDTVGKLNEIEEEYLQKLNDQKGQIKETEKLLKEQTKAEQSGTKEAGKKLSLFEAIKETLREQKDYIKQRAEEEVQSIRDAWTEKPKDFEAGDITGFSAQISYLERKLQDLLVEYDELANAPGFNEQSIEAIDLRSKIEKVNEQLDKMDRKQSKLNKEGFSKMEKGFSGLVKKAGRLALALLGIRTIINLITRSFNTLSQYNEELGTKVEQMRLVLAVALEPVINWLVNMLQVILSLVNQIMSSLFGINLFGRASELWSEKMKKNMASGAGSAKEMKKQLAGFDEMNVLQDNQASNGGGGGGASMEPWDLEEKPIPGWMQWILKNGSLIAGILTGIGVALLLIKLGVGGILALGIGVLIAGIVMLIIDLLKYLKDPSWENFGNIIRDIGIILIGLGIIIGNIPLIVIGAIVLIVGIVIKYWEQIKGFIQGIADWFHQKGEEFKKNGDKFLGGIYQLIGNYVEDVIYIFEWLVGIVKTLFDGIIDFLKKVFAGDWEGAWESIKETFGKIWDKIKEIASKTWERLKENVKIFIDAVVDLHNKLVLWLAEKILGLYNYVKGIIDGIVSWIVDKFNLVVNFFKGIGIAIGDFFSGAIKGAVNGVLSWVESKVNWFIDRINSVISLINKIPGVSIGRLSRISLPRLAVGGIINQPGRGVPVGGAIGGESGREGILPLTDRQAMAELGREIGKWISIQATVPVNIGNRQVARVIQELNTDREFAMNN